MTDLSSNQPLQDVHVRETVTLISPRYLKQEETISDAAIRTVIDARESIKRILAGDESRMIVVVGPCSIHDHAAALEYARKLKALLPIVFRTKSWSSCASILKSRERPSGGRD